jgi:hypothetical protein
MVAKTSNKHRLLAEKYKNKEVRVIRPQTGRQWDFLSCMATEAAYIGEAGGGKSYALLMDFLRDVDKPGHMGILFRKRYKDLEDLIAKAHDIYPHVGGTFEKSKHVWTFPAGTQLWMHYLESEQDVYHWLGWEFSWIGWDEISQFTRMPYLWMYRSFRCRNPDIKKRMRSTSNPDGPGTAWVWDRFHGSLQEGEIGFFRTDNGRDVRVRKGEGASRTWFFSKRQENRKLMDADPNYEKNLDMLPSERLKQAYKHGIYQTYDEPDQLIETMWWEFAVNGKNAKKHGQKAFGLDYAEGTGSDKTVECFGEGNSVKYFREWDYMAHPEMARIIKDDIFGKHGKFQIRGAIDTVGTGAGIYTSLADFKEGYERLVNPVRYKDPRLTAKWVMGSIQIHHKNIQEQILWKLRADFEAGEIDLSFLLTTEGYYDNLHLLREEVLAPWYRIENGYVEIASSNELRKPQRKNQKGESIPCLGRSPDRLKALAMWNYARDWIPDKNHEEFPGDYGYKRPIQYVAQRQKSKTAKAKVYT